MNYRVMVVDDEKEIADLVELYLQNEGYTVFKHYDPLKALECIYMEKLDLAILDVMMPDLDGFALCKRIRESFHYPVIMLTAKEGEADKINGLALGADDYITKPFLPLELVARVKAQLRRYTRYNQGDGERSGHNVITISGLVLNKDKHECFLNEKPVVLTPTEFSILWMLCENQGRVVSSEELFQEVWGEKYFANSNNTVMVHIRHLREKMGEPASHPKYIKTVWGVGYKVEK